MNPALSCIFFNKSGTKAAFGHLTSIKNTCRRPATFGSLLKRCEDSETSGQVLDLMSALNRHYKITFICAAHDDRLRRRAIRIISVKDGRIAGD